MFVLCFLHFFGRGGRGDGENIHVKTTVLVPCVCLRARVFLVSERRRALDVCSRSASPRGVMRQLPHASCLCLMTMDRRVPVDAERRGPYRDFFSPHFVSVRVLLMDDTARGSQR